MPDINVEQEIRARMKRIGVYGTMAIGLIAGVVGLWLLWEGITVAATVTELLWELSIVFTGGLAGAILMVMFLEGKTRAQKVMMPGADENQSLLEWVGRVVGSRSELRKPLAHVPPQLAAIEKDPVAVAILAGLGSIGAGLRALGRYILLAVIFLAIAWSLAPFAASLAP